MISNFQVLAVLPLYYLFFILLPFPFLHIYYSTNIVCSFDKKVSYSLS